MCIYTYCFKKNHPSVLLTFSSRQLRLVASSSFTQIALSIISVTTAVHSSSSFIPLSVSVITVSLLSSADVERFTIFFSSSLSIMRGTFELFSIIRQAISRTHICSGYLPFRILRTLYCSCVNPNSFNSLLITVLSHQAVYSIFKVALCTPLLNLLLCMACSNFTTQMYVHTSNYPNFSFLPLKQFLPQISQITTDG